MPKKRTTDVTTDVYAHERGIQQLTFYDAHLIDDTESVVVYGGEIVRYREMGIVSITCVAVRGDDDGYTEYTGVKKATLMKRNRDGTIRWLGPDGVETLQKNDIGDVTLVQPPRTHEHIATCLSMLGFMFLIAFFCFMAVCASSDIKRFLHEPRPSVGLERN